MRKCLTSLIISSFFITANSQDFLVKNNGDTVKGTLSLHNNIFSISSAAGAVTHYPANSLSYVHSPRHKGLVLEGKLLVYTDNIELVNKWNYNENLRDTFLILKEVYNTPKMLLYEASDKDRAVYYFVKKPKDAKPLQMMVAYFTMTDAPRDQRLFRNERINSTLNQQKIYIDQLKGIMADCTKIKPEDFVDMDYRNYSFKKIIKKYNKCN